MVDWTSFDPPGPALQWLNTKIHKEPYSSIAYFSFWSSFLIFGTPIAVVVMATNMIFRIFLWATGLSGSQAFSPAKLSDTEMAIVVTGCDTGFGKEIAFCAAQAGYVVFAGCLDEASLQQFAHADNIIPVIMNVCKDEDVIQTAASVQQWLKTKTNGGRQRVLHAVINNAGVGSMAPLDWLDQKSFQRDFEGKHALWNDALP